MNYYVEVLKKYADFKGRARRSEYWYFVLFNTIISMALVLGLRFTSLKFLSNLYSLGVMIPSIAVSVRRMHDVNKSGWWILCPIYNIVLLFTQGTTGPNDYGSDPKNSDIQEEVEQIGNNI